MNEQIDVVIISFNEEEVIGDAIKSVKGWAKNIIVVDGESTDKTFEIAKKLGVSVFSHKFDDFSSQRNFALEKVKSPWVMFLDADERVTESFKKEINEKIKNPEISAFIVKRKTFYFNHDWGLTDEVARVFKRQNFKKWTGVVHESALFKGESEVTKTPILHYTHRNLSQMLDKTNKWSNYEAKLRFENHHPKMKPWRFVRVMITEFFKSYVRENGYKNGTYGVVEAIYQSYSIFITYAKLWELQSKTKGE